MLREHVADRLAVETTTLVGRPFETRDPAQRLEFADWLIALTDRLGLEIKIKEQST